MHDTSTVHCKGGPKSVIVEDETLVIIVVILYLQQQFDILTGSAVTSYNMSTSSECSYCYARVPSFRCPKNNFICLSELMTVKSKLYVENYFHNWLSIKI